MYYFKSQFIGKLSFVFALTLVALIACPSTADSILIEFDGLDVEYDGSSIFDADPGLSDPDPVTDTEISVNGGLISSPTGVTVDLSIPGVEDIEVGLGTDTVTSAGGGTLDIDFGSGDFLSLLLDPVSVIYADAGFVQFVIGAAIASVDGQDLPAGLTIGSSVTVEFNVDVDSGSLTDDGDFITGFTAAGLGAIEGELDVDPMNLPEPATVILALFGLVGMSIVSFTSTEAR